MRSSLRILVTDLEIRADLAARALHGAPSLRGRSADAAAQVEHTAAEARRLLTLDLEGEADALYPTYQRLTAGLHVRETFELPFLVLHDAAAARATALCSALLDDIGWPYERLLVSTFSTGYYWTIAALRVIAEPCGEERRLLGVPDLCHELGHSVYANDDVRLVGSFMVSLQAHLQASIDPAVPEGEPGSKDWLTDAFQIWEEGWLQEFVCDLIATYLIGPAFLAQHVRLRAMAQPAPAFHHLDLEASHPADDARMRACLHMLRRRGFNSQAMELTGVWQEMIETAADAPGARYDLAYPDALLADLAERVEEGCEALGLRALDPTLDPDDDIPKLVDEAYRRLVDDPGSYADWERKALEDRWAEWKV